MHLFWRLPADVGPVTAAWVTCEITDPPTVDELYFWALQATFTDEHGSDFGTGHTGLQWNPRHPHHGAVNWGGYPAQHDNWQTNLRGSKPTLPGFRDDPNTRHYRWAERTPYRIAIYPGEPADDGTTGWRASVHNLATDERTVLRDLWTGGTQLKDLCVWTEWFCPCDTPTAAISWTGFRVQTIEHGEAIVREPEAVFINHPNENCANVGHRIVDQLPELVIEQRMNTVRELPHGTVVPIRPPQPVVGTLVV